MAETLSQNELHAILNATSASREAGTKPESEPSRVEPYDFSHPDLLSRDQVRAIRTLHEGFAQALAKRLSTEFLSNVSVTVVSVDHLTYGEFLVLLPSPTVLAVVAVPTLEGNIAIEFNPSIAFTFIDRTLGGAGAPLQKLRALTAIEEGLMARVLQLCCQELAGIWLPFLELSFVLQSIEGNPEIARVIDPGEMTVLVAFELKMNEVTGVMNLCLPYVVMEKAFQRLGHGAAHAAPKGSDSKQLREGLVASLHECEVAVQVELGRVELTLQEILGLEEGDVLRVPDGATWGATGSIEGQPRLAGVPGRHRGNRAFEVMEVHSMPAKEEEAK
jgi:flagellar motor switch protein FliM